MDRSNFFFSIIICCYNSEKFISQTLESIIKQKFKQYEIVIIDDGSSDNTSYIIKNLIKDNSNIKLIKQNNQGLATSRNIAINNSSSDWIMIIDHDDILEENRLQVQYDEIINNDSCKLFFGDVILFDNDKFKKKRFAISREKDNFDPLKLNLKKIKAYYNLIQHGCFIVSSSVVFNKKCAETIGFFNPKYKFLTDYIFFLKFAYRYDFYCSDKIISYLRIHKDQSTIIMKNLYFLELNKFYISCYFNNKLPIYYRVIILYKQLRLLLSFLIKKLKL